MGFLDDRPGKTARDAADAYSLYAFDRKREFEFLAADDMGGGTFRYADSDIVYRVWLDRARKGWRVARID